MSAIKEALGEMATSGKRVKVHDAQTVLKLPTAVKDLVKKVADERGVSEATIYREAVAEYLTRRGYNR